jgi:phosphotransacetylase
MPLHFETLSQLVDLASEQGPVRVAVAGAADPATAATLREAHARGLVEPWLVGDRPSVSAACEEAGWTIEENWLVDADGEAGAAAQAVELAREGEADVLMKGHVHTDALMRAALDGDRGLRLPDRRVSHVFLVEANRRSGLFGITDAAINIAPDLNAKAEILRNAVGLFHLLGLDRPNVAVLSAVETVNADIASTLDAACLALMARRGQIAGAEVDGPLAFDNAISAEAAERKGIRSTVAGNADLLLAPDLVSGNILAKTLEHLAGAVAAGIALGLRTPAALSSRADPPQARLASLALAALVHHRAPKAPLPSEPVEQSLHCAPQPDRACCPLAG